MDFPSDIFPQSFLWLANLLALLVLAWAFYRAPLARLRENAFSHLLFAASVVILLLWNLRAGIHPGISFHVLGMTALTLMVGWHYALIAAALALLGSTLNGIAGPVAYGLNLLVMGALPVSLTWAALRLAQRHFPRNFFVYVLFNAFLVAGLGAVAVTLAGAALLWAFDVYQAHWLGYQYLRYFPLVFFAEGVANGMVMTMMVALRPEWVCTFDDRRYLYGK